MLKGFGAAALASMPVVGASGSDSDQGSSRRSHASEAVSETKLRAFFDEKINEQLDEHDIAGATVSVVAGGETVFASGYGYSDVQNEEPVSAEETVFRVGSVSKAVTGTAVMTAVEDGDVDLNTDVNEYLGEDLIPDTYDEPVTLERLGTHTAGFETTVTGLFRRERENVGALREAVQDPPQRVRPPGSLASYSNYGVGLAGHVLSEATGTGFAEYVEQNVFEPLGMEKSTFRQPPPEMEGSVSNGYVYDYREGGFQEEGFEYIPLRPAGSMSATATDMARFMVAHLNGGELDGSRVLEQDTSEGMRGARFRNHPELNGVGYGFYEMTRGDTRIVAHGGDTILFHSMMALFTDDDVGVFVSYNNSGSAQAREDLMDEFVDEFFPPEQPEGEGIDPERPERAEDLEGWYRTTRITETTYEKIIGAPSTVEVRFEDDGTMVTSRFLLGEEDRWVETEPLVFRKENGNEHLAFRERDGEITHMFMDSSPVAGMESLSSTEEPVTQLTALGASTAMILSGIAGWSAASLWRRLRSRMEPYTEAAGEPSGADKGEGKRTADVHPADAEDTDMDGGYDTEDTEGKDHKRVARWAAGAAGGSLVGSVFAFALVFVIEPSSIIYGMPSWFTAVFVLSGLGLFGTVSAAGFAVLAWREGYWSLLHRVHYTILVLSELVFLWLLGYWNLLPGPV